MIRLNFAYNFLLKSSLNQIECSVKSIKHRVFIQTNCLHSKLFCMEDQKSNMCSMSTCNSEFNETNSINDSSQESVLKIPTAGIIVIGDEILKGQTLDVNTQYLTENLYKLGVKVEKVSVIPDDIPTIAEEVSIFSKRFTHVITSGGIGPTHDDLTFEGIAAAFNEKVVPHPKILDFIHRYFKTTDTKSPAMKMAQIPESAELHYGVDQESGGKAVYPCITVHNVVVFPGIPHLLKKSFGMNGTKLFGHKGGGFFTSKIYFSSDEISLADMLNETVAKYPTITIGSYPELFHSYYKTKITLESLDNRQLTEAENYLRTRVNEDRIVEYISDTITDPWAYVDILSPPIRTLLNEALDALKQCFDRYRPEEICLCYNGGKDCLVTLHILHLFMKKNFPQKRIQAMYITENSFPQVTEFVNLSINKYNLDCEILPGPIKVALAGVIKNRPSIKAVIMGTRRVDPHGDQLSLFSPTDGNWPPVMRVNPVLEWKYNQIWSFIRELYLPYCSLYDRGYTSLGSVYNTLPNPSLERRDSIGRQIFLPAHCLQDPDLERKGRLV